MDLSNLFTYETLVHAIAGATGSVIGVTTFYPLEIIKLRSIVHVRSTGSLSHEEKSVLAHLEHIIEHEGIGMLYQGLDPMVKSLYTSNFVYFYAFNMLKSLHGSSSPSILRDLCLSSIAGIINVLTTTPLWVVNTRMKLSSNQYSGLMHGLGKIYWEEGVGALWKGTLASIILVSNPAIQMSVYELLKRYSLHIDNSAAKFFILASLSKIVSTLITYPVQIAQHVQRVSRSPQDLHRDVGLHRIDEENLSDDPSSDAHSADSGATRRSANNTRRKKVTPESMIDILLYIFKYEGIRGLYRGVEAKLLQTVLTAALMFVTYEKIVSLVLSTFNIERKLKG